MWQLPSQQCDCNLNAIMSHFVVIISLQVKVIVKLNCPQVFPHTGIYLLVVALVSSVVQRAERADSLVRHGRRPGFNLQAKNVGQHFDL